ncbi:MAG: hypothetical protein WCQ50_11150 [Spirochaetota bacterium]
MESTVSTKNMVSIPQAIARQTGITPGWKLDWRMGEHPDELIVTVIPDRAERARRLLGKGLQYAAERHAVDELLSEREAEG